MLTILYVDDEPDIREIASLALSLDHRITVELAASGREALDRLGKGGIDLVLLDVMMPEMDGPATLARMRSNDATSGIPVVFVTARTQQREIDQYIASGACGVICKPFDPMSLAQTVRGFVTDGAA